MAINFDGSIEYVKNKYDSTTSPSASTPNASTSNASTPPPKQKEKMF